MGKFPHTQRTFCPNLNIALAAEPCKRFNARKTFSRNKINEREVEPTVF